LVAKSHNSSATVRQISILHSTVVTKQLTTKWAFITNAVLCELYKLLLSFRGVGRSPPWLLDLEAFQYLTRNELADVFANVLIATYRMYLCFS